MNHEKNLCPLCGGVKEKGHTTFTADLGSGLVVARRVPATICSQCGEEWIDDATAARLERDVNAARKNHHEFEVVSYA